MENVNVVLGVEVVAEGLALHYVRLPKDVRKNGLEWKHTVLVPRDSDYDDELAAVLEALNQLLADALDDEDRAEPIDMDQEEEEDDDE